MLVRTILALLYDVVLLGVCGWAIRRGGRPERLGAMLNLVASSLSSIARTLTWSSWAPGATFITAIDLAVVGGFFWLAITTTRFWPIWAFGFALANVLIGLAGILLPSPSLLAYTSGLGVYAYLALGALAVGVFHLPQDADPVVRHGFRSRWQRDRESRRI